MNLFKTGATALALGAMIAAPSAQADTYPSKAVTIMVGFSAGGGVDLFARNLSAALPNYVGKQPVVVLNKTGGAQVPAMKILQKSKPDGYTTMLLSMGSVIVATGLRDRGVDPFKDFKFVAQIGVNNLMAAASKESGFKTPQDVIEGIKKAHANGKKLRWGNPGRGSVTGLAMIAWLNKNGVYEMTQDVPFKGGTKVRVAILGNNVDFGALALSNASGGYDEKMNIIATFGSERDPAAPQYPTMGDLNSPYVPMATPLVLAVPKDTPSEIVSKLEAAVKKSTEDAGFKERAAKSGQSVVFRNSEEVRRYAEKLKAEWNDTIQLVRKRMAEAKN